MRLRDRLVLTFAPMVKYIVYRKVREIPARCDVEDFISCGLEALIRSIDRYDPDKGATLEQFAWTRIHGAVLDELRRHDWAPRSLRRWERDINRARERFIAALRPLAHARGARRRARHHGRGADHAAWTRSRVSDVGSLNTLVLGDDDTTIERIDTLASNDRDSDPEHASRARARRRSASAPPSSACPSASARSRCCSTSTT